MFKSTYIVLINAFVLHSRFRTYTVLTSNETAMGLRLLFHCKADHDIPATEPKTQDEYCSKGLHKTG